MKAGNQVIFQYAENFFLLKFSYTCTKNAIIRNKRFRVNNQLDTVPSMREMENYSSGPEYRRSGIKSKPGK